MKNFNDEGTLMRYDAAIDLAFRLSNEAKEVGDEWRYAVEITAANGNARVAVYDEDNIKLGYL